MTRRIRRTYSTCCATLTSFSAVVQEILELKLLREVSPDPLSLSQFHLLKLISLNGQHQVGQVADFLGVSAPAASKNIDKLERLGLVAREQCKGDRRAILLASSRRGRQLVEAVRGAEGRQRLMPVLDSFSTEGSASIDSSVGAFLRGPHRCGRNG